jgi:hypothetical protein
MSSDMPEIGDKLKTPFENLVVAKEYLETSQSDIQWRDRVWQVAEDTTTINFSYELGQDAGSFGAGALSNKIANKYMDEMIETCATLTNQEKLNEEIFKLVAKDQGLDSGSVRGTGVIREFIQGDFCDPPERNARPFDDDSRQGPLEDGIIFNSKNHGLNSIFESSSSTGENQEGFFCRFFGLFGGVSDDNNCPVNGSEYPYSDSSFIDNLRNKLGFFIPETGGAYHCTDPSMMVPPSPFISDFGDFCSDS